MSIASQLNAIQSPSIAAMLASGSKPADRAAQGGQSFWEQLSVKMSATETVQSEPMSLDEYKQKISAMISAMPVHPSQADASHSVSIHDKAFEKMMNDPEFEEKILGQIRDSLAANFYPSDPAYHTVSFDAEGEYRGWSAGSAWGGTYEKKSADAFWKRNDDAAEKAADKRREDKRLLDALLDKRLNRLQDMRTAFFERALSGAVGESSVSGGGSGQGGTLASGLASFFG